MPNLEIHGFSAIHTEELREIIFTFIQRLSFANDLVITICPTRVVDRHGKDQPYFRLIHTAGDSPSGDIDQLIDGLRTYADVEEVEIIRFLPKKAHYPK